MEEINLSHSFSLLGSYLLLNSLFSHIPSLGVQAKSPVREVFHFPY